jgi:hypothetical protein
MDVQAKRAKFDHSFTVSTIPHAAILHRALSRFRLAEFEKSNRFLLRQAPSTNRRPIPGRQMCE